MSKERLDEMIKSQNVTSNVFLLWGEEAFLRLHYKKNLVSLLMPSCMPELNYYSFDGKDYSTVAIDEAIEALPVMDTQKLLVFDNSMLFKPDGRTGAKADVREYWEKRLKDIPPYVYIIFSENEIDKRSAIYKHIDKNFLSAEFSYLDEAKMIRWVMTLFNKLGKNISQKDATYLLTLCPDGMMYIKNEAEKLCAFCNSKTDVTKEDIDLLVMPKLEDRVFDMVNAMLCGKAEEAMLLLSDLVALKTEPTQILGAVIYNLDKIACVKKLLKSGKSAGEIASFLKLAPFMVKKFSGLASNFTDEKLSEMISKASKTDIELKTNSMDNSVLLELFIMNSI